MATLGKWFDRHPKLGFVLAFAVFVPVLFVGQCLLRGWGYWADALAITLMMGVTIGAIQYFFVLRPTLRAREEGR